MVEPSDQVAVSLAMSAAFFSNDQAPISTRTIRFISATHFPPGIVFTRSGPLYGIENTNRGCGFNVTYLPGQSLPMPTALTGGPGPGIITGKPTETTALPTISSSIPVAFPSSRTAWSPEASASPAPTPPRRSMPPTPAPS